MEITFNYRLLRENICLILGNENNVKKVFETDKLLIRLLDTRYGFSSVTIQLHILNKSDVILQRVLSLSQ